MQFVFSSGFFLRILSHRNGQVAWRCLGKVSAQSPLLRCSEDFNSKFAVLLFLAVFGERVSSEFVVLLFLAVFGDKFSSKCVVLLFQQCLHMASHIITRFVNVV